MEYVASGTVSAGPVTLKYVQVITNGAANAVVIGYNKPTSSGIAAANKVFEFTVVAANHYGGGSVGGRDGVRCDEGLYVTVSGAGASFIPDC